MNTRLAQIVALLALCAQPPCAFPAGTILGPNDATLCFRESQMQFGRDPDSCTDALRNGGLTRRDEAATYSNRGIIYSKMDELEKALQDQNRAIELMPEMTQAYINRGNVYFHLRRFDEALLEYERAVEMKAGPLYLPHFNSGIALLKLKRDAEAVLAFERALELAPESERVKKKLAQAKSIVSSSDPE